MIERDDQIPANEGDDLVAAEYVLGVLPLAEREATTRRIETDPAFARLVDAWQVRLTSLSAAYADVTPPAGTKTAIDRRLFSTAASPAATSGSVWSSLALWRGLTLAALVAFAVAIALPYAGGPALKPAEQRLVASLADDGTDVRYLAVYDAARHEIGLSQVAGERGQGRDFELWVIEGQNAPRSLGVIPVGDNVRVSVAAAVGRAVATGSVFAISVEPQGGSPTGAPTGPVVAAGDLRAI